MIQKEDKAEADCRVWEATSGTGWINRTSRGPKVLKKEGFSACYHEVEREPLEEVWWRWLQRNMRASRGLAAPPRRA